MASYRIVCEVIKGEIVFYEFDGCRNGRLYYGAEDYCTEKCGIWVYDREKATVKLQEALDIHRKRCCDYELTDDELKKYQSHKEWREELVKFKVEGVA
jgi:hypothetical protein